MFYILYKKVLRVIIEIKRKRMYRKAQALGFTHPEVVNCSQQLDNLLNKYTKQAA
ncbi:Spo0E family sporulation regulatory protein-aspartic acid phosphatase [Ureibacillus thermophilus]|uniref:Aspartyl-phosphate phosphatase Spo0E family protein n=1 Tax=Ureibacillus thermophilus TaxID=367743 RepID=A0A4P6UST0_9BACL|nr:aspartyl-phosphate phosphatase Spo0E family protein [Ureibacillus thermophilus]QBK26154.1 aspartyl-phosphate phosphatase Spo0E family protein [Ureibacillus thermophilus]